MNLIAGRRPVLEALKAGTKIEKIVFLAGVHGQVIDEIKSMAAKHHVQVDELARQEFRKIANDSTTQGIVAIVQARGYASFEEVAAAGARRSENGFILILDEIEDPHNLGALIRTAECAGVHGVIIPKHHSATLTGTVAKASAGATEYVPVAGVTNLVNTIAKLKQLGYWIVGLDGAGDKLYTGVDYTSSIALVVGNEGKGIRRLVKEHCDHLVRIPLHGKIESLNASVAGGLVMYEVAKQRHR